MTTFLRFITLAACLLSISACNNSTDTPPQQEIVGQRMTIKANGKEYYLTINGRIGNVISSEATNWKHELLYKNQYYRGLLLKGREEDGRHWELDIDFKKLDALFPLAVGDAIAVKGSFVNYGENSQMGYRVQLSVVAEVPITLPSGTYNTYQVKISQYYTTPKGPKEWHQTVFHSPELGVNLRGIYKDNGEEKQWYITDIQQPEEGTLPSTPARPRRRSGTVMI